MPNVISFGPKVDDYLCNRNPDETEAFLNGLQTAKNVIEILGLNEFMRATAKCCLDLQDIVPLLVKTQAEQDRQMNQDTEAMLAYCDPVDPWQFVAFLLDVPKVDEKGHATSEDGKLLEDDDYRLLPGKVNSGWLNREIRHARTDVKITREEYLALSEDERLDYVYCRYFDLCKFGAPYTAISDGRTCVIEHLIYRVIMMDNECINERLYASSYRDKEHGEYTILARCYDVIVHAMTELANSYRYRRSITSPGYLLLTQIEYFSDLPNVQMRLSYAVSGVGAQMIACWCDVIRACYYCDDDRLMAIIPDRDIINYRDSTGRPFLVNAFDATNPKDWKTSFRTIFVPKTAHALVEMVHYVDSTIDVESLSAAERQILKVIVDCLLECSYIMDDDVPAELDDEMAE